MENCHIEEPNPWWNAAEFSDEDPGDLLQGDHERDLGVPIRAARISRQQGELPFEEVA